jgi:hypothetical protein
VIGLGCLALAFGCGNNAINNGVCSPPCATGFHCENANCVSDGVSDDAGPPGDMAVSCSPACSGLTAHCNDSHHCVGCTSDDQCAMGSYCKIAGDTLATCTPGCMTADRCGGSLMCCEMQCADTTSDAQNCGMCGQSCTANHAHGVCAASKCQAGTCDTGYGDCNNDGSDGCEANLHLDEKNCMSCGNQCALAHAVQGCSDGCYIKACTFGWDDCNNNIDDGCETSVLTDVSNCGSCSTPCNSLPNAAANCTAGNCVLGACKPGFADCNNDPKDGCEVNLAIDKNNCSKCGMACPLNLPNCGNGVCTVMPQCVRVGWKPGGANWACPNGYRMPTINEWNSVMPCVTPQDNMMFGTMADVAIDVGGCNCKWNMNWCGQPSIDTIRQGRMCGDYQQLQICLQ